MLHACPRLHRDTAPRRVIELHPHPEAVGRIGFFVALWWVAFIGQVDPKGGVDALVIGITNTGGG